MFCECQLSQVSDSVIDDKRSADRNFDAKTLKQLFLLSVKRAACYALTLRSSEQTVCETHDLLTQAKQESAVHLKEWKPSATLDELEVRSATLPLITALLKRCI